MVALAVVSSAVGAALGLAVPAFLRAGASLGSDGAGYLVNIFVVPAVYASILALSGCTLGQIRGLTAALSAGWFAGIVMVGAGSKQTAMAITLGSLMWLLSWLWQNAVAHATLRLHEHLFRERRE